MDEEVDDADGFFPWEDVDASRQNMALQRRHVKKRAREQVRRRIGALPELRWGTRPAGMVVLRKPILDLAGSVRPGGLDDGLQPLPAAGQLLRGGRELTVGGWRVTDCSRRAPLHVCDPKASGSR